MTTAELLSERASALAGSDSSDADAIDELLECAAGHRVSVVVAKRRLTEESQGDASGVSARAVTLLQGVIDLIPV